MKKVVLVLIALVLVFALSACSKGYTNISNSELVEMLDSDVDYYFIDVRTLEEYYDERISGFNMNYDLYLFEDDYSLLESLDITRPVVLMCRSGNRSVEASNIFLDIGFTEVYNLKNGIKGWNGDTIN